MSIKIYHNPRCSKSRQTLQILNDKNRQPEIIEYLKTPPDKQTLEEILRLLKMEPRELLRKTEADYKILGLGKGDFSREQLIEFMVKHPKLIERPIIINGNKAVIGRPPEQVLEII